ncbi:hypothetical protein SBC2_85670 (plasmid) [Caballeronia sp. SBC2]|nr:hypothetical protein SBC2_85670 [Caballeronia sp. SBC2]
MRLFRNKRQAALATAPGMYAEEDPSKVIFETSTRLKLDSNRWMCCFAPNPDPLFASNIDPPFEPVFLGLGSGCLGLFSLLFRLCRAVLETIAIVSGFHNVAVMGEPV